MLNKRNLLALTLVSAMSISLLSACGTKSESTSGASTDPASSPTAAASSDAPAKQEEFSFYFTGSANVKGLWDKITPMFEKAHPEVKVKLVYIPSGTGAQPTYDRLVAAKQAGKGSGDIDLYEDGLSSVTKGKKDDLWDTLPSASIANLAKVDQKRLESISNLAVPYRASAVVIAYNSDKVKTAPNTMDDVFTWIRQNPGKFAYNDPSTGGSGDSFVLTTIYKSMAADAIYNQDPSVEKEWDAGFALLKELGPLMYNKGIYPKKNQGTLDILASGEVDMIPAWSDMALDGISKGTLPASTKLKQLDPGMNGGPTYLMVPKLSEKKEAVYKFLDFVLTPEAQTVIINEMHGFPGIELSNMPQEIQDQFTGVSGGFRSFDIGDLDKDMLKRWQSEVAAQ
ncbi:extracellular solute-binding protein [Paenibacillus psychroresistens]|uniref:Extracellular solute-binding protein n=1 Tax=Paenibacillus psychroresistens TaxID=1778678 RepID=A0A6B8RGT0_9BACL|nr:extracellular solute-binding protein [Paenibacillus psychroresistens]QGQ94742.1 extracellular solute-binding protein [Paenibacillus psychroresistens]